MLSLIFWTLTVVVSLKYVLLILRADNNGEGGLIAMLALASQAVKRPAACCAAGCCCWASSAPRSSSATASSRRPSRCCRRSRVWRWPRPALHRYVVPITLVVLTGAVRGAALRHRRRRPALRAGHAGLVRRAGAAGRAAHRRSNPAGAGGAEPALRAGLPAGAPAASPSSALGAVVLCVTGGRGAVCRPGPLRQAADPPGLVRARVAGAGAQLLRPGRDAAAAPREREATRSTRWRPTGRCSR